MTLANEFLSLRGGFSWPVKHLFLSRRISGPESRKRYKHDPWEILLLLICQRIVIPVGEPSEDAMEAAVADNCANTITATRHKASNPTTKTDYCRIIKLSAS